MAFNKQARRRLTLGLVLATLVQWTMMGGIAQADPEFDQINAIIYRGYLYVFGNVSDPDEDVEGGTVTITGDVSGQASIRADGSFIFGTLYSYAYGSATAQAFSPTGVSSDTEMFEFTE